MRDAQWLALWLVFPLAGCAASLDFDGQSFREADSTVDETGSPDSDVNDTGADDTAAQRDTEPLFDVRQDTGEADAEPDSGCEPRPEVCDGLDNDCDGLIDDADPTVVWDASNCGACGEDCSGAARAVGICNADRSCEVQRCAEAGYRDLNQVYADGCEFSIGAPLHWLSRLAVSGFVQVSGSEVVAWGDSGAQVYRTGSEPLPAGAFGVRGTRVVSAEVIGATLLLGLESITDGTGLIYRHPIGAPFSFDQAAAPVRLSRPATDIAASGGRILVSSAAPGVVQLFEEISGSYRFLGSVNPFGGADVLGLAVSGDGSSGYAVGRDGSVRGLVLAATGTPIALGSASLPGEGGTEAMAQTSLVQGGRLLVAMLLRSGGGGGDRVRIVADSGAGLTSTTVSLPTSDGVAVSSAGGEFRVLQASGVVSRVSASGSGPVETIAAPPLTTLVRAFGPGALSWLLATEQGVVQVRAEGGGATASAMSPTNLSPSGVAAHERGWLLATGEGGTWTVSETATGEVSASLVDAGSADFVARGGDGASFVISREGLLRGWLDGGPVSELATGLTGVLELRAGDGVVVLRTGSEVAALPYLVGDASLFFDGEPAVLSGTFSGTAVSGSRVALLRGLEVTLYDAARGWTPEGSLVPPASAGGATGAYWTDADRLLVMDAAAGLWLGDRLTGAVIGTAILSAAAGVQSDAEGGLFGFGELAGWRSADRGIALWFADRTGNIRLGTLDATRPGVSAYLQTPCATAQGAMNADSAAAVTGCGLSLWRHRAQP